MTGTLANALFIREISGDTEKKLSAGSGRGWYAMSTERYENKPGSELMASRKVPYGTFRRQAKVSDEEEQPAFATTVL